MPRNRSAPPCSVVPVLTYPDVADAVDWLTRVFGFVEHVRIGDHRAQLGLGDGAVIVADTSHGRRAPGADDTPTHSVMVRVDDLDAHYQRALSGGAGVLGEPADHAYGERQYAAVDPAGHHWTFTQSVADIAPEDWGGSTVAPWQPYVELARARAAKAAVNGRVAFEVASVTTFNGTGYDLVTSFACLHTPDPLGAARHIRAATAAHGCWMLVEPTCGCPKSWAWPLTWRFVAEPDTA